MNSSFKNIRKDLVGAMTCEMMGPGSEGYGDSKEEVISESPLQRYSVGILYPQKLERDLKDELDDTAQNALSDRAEADEALECSINTANQYYPSSMGISFYTNKICPTLKVKVSTAKYRRLNVNECTAGVEPLPEGVQLSSIFNRLISYENGQITLKDKITKTQRDDLIRLYEHEGYRKAVYKIYDLMNSGWKRVPIDKEVLIPSDSSGKVRVWEETIVEELKLMIISRPISVKNKTLFTATLINNFKAENEKNDEESFFQVSFSVSPAEKDIQFLDYNLHNKFSDDDEELSLALLYRNKKTYAVGHGCAVCWNCNESGDVIELETKVIPSYEVHQLKFEIEEIDNDLKRVLSMKNLSDLSTLDKQQIIELLEQFCARYEEWIKKINGAIPGIDPTLHKAASKHIEECFLAYERMVKGIHLLKTDDDIFWCFQLANRAMFMQRLHSELQAKARFPGEDSVSWPDYQNVPEMYACWRPFQLAFILLNIPGISSDNTERDYVDLIWFPTGGGKTEAYLGVSAFTIFLRRKVNKEAGYGTTIIMRYTLRLLTAQQFQRASTMICACEMIRREMPDILGIEEISIGLWIGSASTPNDTNSALSILDKLVKGTEEKNPFQVLICPWCGTKLVKEKLKGTVKGKWGYKKGSKPKRFIVHCTENDCAFHDELPIRVVDEDIYHLYPTLLFGTVDKFALMPWKKEISNIFALNEGNNNLSPELIIQDELHLISGPLGTVVGIYETALDALCSAKGRKPKIIASTATIRRAGDQVKSLYEREVKQFPPPGIDAEDSFFAREATLEEKPGRLYVGILAVGKTQTTIEIRLMAALLQYIKELPYPDDIKDKYWTLVGYFNTIRELGKASTLAEDDIKDQVRRIGRRRQKEIRLFYEAEELTSRKSPEDIPAILERLKVSYPEKDVIQILLATNMISVGVDVDRLGLMTVVGQPKTTSEYIQATSRVGRKYPGLILTLYDGARYRDRSHYEQFIPYHEAFYKFVEPTSVTPFSGPARDRCLHAVLITLVRHLQGLRKDEEAGNFDAKANDTRQIVEFILARVKKVMNEEFESTKDHIIRIVEYWNELAEVHDNLTYATLDKPHLLYPAGKRDKYQFFCGTLQSMRSVDAECNVLVLD